MLFPTAAAAATCKLSIDVEEIKIMTTLAAGKTIPFKVVSVTSFVAYASASDLEINSANFASLGTGSFNHGWQSAS